MNRPFQRVPGLISVLTLLVTAQLALAHRLDEYLQATLIEIKPDEVHLQINMNPGVLVAEAVIGMIDRDRDGKITRAEGDNYAIQLLKQLEVTLDDEALKLQFRDATFDPVADLQTGNGNARINLRAALKPLSEGIHSLSFHNRHQPELSVYLLNAVLPKTAEIRILKQIRNDQQSSGRIQFSFELSRSSPQTATSAE